MERVENIANHEIQTGGGSLHLEYGVHEFSVFGISNSDSSTRFINGDLSAHYWNREILERISRYKPSFVCSDTMPGIYGHVLYPDEISSAWYTLPGSPSQISGKDFVYSVAADYFGVGIDDDDKYLKESVASYAKEDATTFLVGVATAVAAKVMFDKFFSQKPEAMARRDFLKRTAKWSAMGSGLFVASLPIVRWLSAYTAGQTSNRFLHDLLSDIADITRHRFSTPTWVDGRSALIIAKAQEAQDHLPKGDRDGVAILGFPHAFEGERLLHSESARAEKIRDFVRMISETAREYNGNVLTDQELKGAAIDFFTRTAILKIEEPRTTSESLSQLVSFHALYRSKEIERALRSLTF